MDKKRIISIVFVIFLSCLLNACGNGDTNIKSNNGNKIISTIKESLDHQGIKNFILKFSKAIFSEDSKSFKEMMDKDGIYSITYFVDGRDQNVVLHLYQNEIRDDLVLANSKKMGIGLSSMFYLSLVNDVKSIPIHSNKILNDISFNVDWHINDENMVETKLNDIIQTCQKINLINNKDIPQVFVLKDNMFAFAKSSGVLKPSPEFTGDWVIFEKVGSEYKLRAVMQLL